MKKIKKEGFTLVELLAVIVIIAIILAIAIPSISNVIDRVSRNAFESDAKMILKAVEYKVLEDRSMNISDVNESTMKAFLNIDNSNYQTVTIKEINDKRYITIVGKNKWDKLTVSGTKTYTKVTDTVTTFVGGANAPVLATGMTPIKWNGTTWVNTTASDTSWYNYDTTNKIWANAKTADGSFWVWIPRYVYRIPAANWHTSTAGTIDIQFTKGVDDNWNKAIIGNIDVREGAEASNAGTNGNKYTNHPAFTFGSTELTGIWVAKFEASAVEGNANGYTADGSCPTAGDNISTKTVKIVPNTASWRCQTIGNAFAASRNMETNSVYGWGTSGSGIDTHLIKSVEWGSVIYLALSSYGKNADIWLNNSSTYITGCAGNSVSEATYAGCQNTYNTTNGLQSSTIGNIYGIYDMSGGAWERIAAYINNGNNNLSTYGSNILSADAKYKDVYSAGAIDTEVNNYALAINKKGDGIYEISSSTPGTTSWYTDYSNMGNTIWPWVVHGGTYGYGASGGAFLFSATGADMLSEGGFRPVLLVGKGL